MSKTVDDTHTIKLCGKTYKTDSLTDFAKNIIEDMQKVDGLIQQQQLQLSVSSLAKGKLLEELEKESSKFEEIEKGV